MADRFRSLKYLVLFMLGLLLAGNATASHIYGGELYYTYNSGTRYTVTMVLYGDCSAKSDILSALYTATPEVQVYNGATIVRTLKLKVHAGAGTEVTPVCAASKGSTTCGDGLVPGIRQFIYSDTINLGASSAWKFRFTGDFKNGTLAGRSNSITNLVIDATGSLMSLEATLDNTVAPNSNPTFTTIPTPFFCINVPQEYNQGAVDVNTGDSLVYALVDGLDATTTPSSLVTYRTGYTATTPLAVASGTFSFSTSTGQLGFKPNLTQMSTVVCKVSEYRGGVLVGTCMREMNFIVLSSCSNKSPSGDISGVSSGTLKSATVVDICKNESLLSFKINPTDADGDTIWVSYAGLPAGATMTITGDGTKAPSTTFNWDISGVAPGAYYFYMTYLDNGCPLSSKQTIAYTVNVVAKPSFSYELVSEATCIRKAVFKVTPLTGIAPWTLSVLKGTAVVHTITGLTAATLDSLVPGSYTLRLKGNNNCFIDFPIVLAVPVLPVVSSYANTAPNCYNSNDGAVSITGTGTLPPYTYAIGSGAYTTSGTFSGLAAGTYVLHIKDNNSCQKDTTVVLTAPLPVRINSYFTTPVSCNNNTDGAVGITVSGGTSPYSYAIDGGAYTLLGTFSGLPGGTYVLHVRDAHSCQKDTTVTLLNPPVLKIGSYTGTPISCYNSNDAVINIVASGGTSPYTYAIGTGAYTTSGNFTGLAPGTYVVHIKDARLCQKDTTVVFTAPSPLLINSYSATIPVCYGGADGKVSITASGGTTPYTYAIGSGSFVASGSFSSLRSGAYVLRIKDAGGCVKDTSVTLGAPPELKIDNYLAKLPSCYNGTDGSLTISGTGTTSPYTYAIGSGAYTLIGTFMALGSGTYVLHIRDGKSCQKDTTVVLADQTPVAVSYAVRKATCNTVSDGRITLTASGGVSPYMYKIGTSGTYTSSNVFSSLGIGTYTISVKDANSCTKEIAIVVTDSITIGSSAVVKPVVCNGSKDGVITITGLLGKSPYTYALGSGGFSTANTFTGLGKGMYILYIRDANGCSRDTAVTVTEPPVLGVSAVVTGPSCIGNNDAVITMAASGGMPGYGYAIAGGSYTSDSVFEGLATGTYTLSVADAGGCKKDTVIEIAQPEGIYPNVTFTDPLCYGGKDGTITFHTKGGTPAYQYAVDGSALQPGNVFRNIGAGPRTVQVTDSKGCRKDSAIVISQPPLLVFDSLLKTNPTCEGYADGAVRLGVSGGTPGYLYAAGTGAYSAAALIGNLREGVIQLHVRDANGCQSDTVTTLTGYPHIIMDSVITTPTTCFGRSDAAFLLYASGGNGTLNYVMEGHTDTSQHRASYSGLPAGPYTVTVTDATHCSRDFVVLVPDAEKLRVVMDVLPNNCIGLDTSGRITARVSGGTLPYTYMWNTGSADSIIHSLPNGTYAVRISDRNDCRDSATGIVAYDNCCVPGIPNAFTPNNDGKNDQFNIIYKGDIVLKEFSIYNRYGQRVFYTTDITMGWDGQFNGHPMDLGTYYYYVRMLCGNNQDKEVSYKGDVILIR